jgi:hypothetical protein
MVFVADATAHVVNHRRQAQQSKISASQGVKRRENLDQFTGNRGNAPFMARVAHIGSYPPPYGPEPRNGAAIPAQSVHLTSAALHSSSVT